MFVLNNLIASLSLLLLMNYFIVIFFLSVLYFLSETDSMCSTLAPTLPHVSGENERNNNSYVVPTLSDLIKVSL